MRRLTGFSKCVDQVRGVLKPRGIHEEILFNQAKENKGIVNIKED